MRGYAVFGAIGAIGALLALAAAAAASPANVKQPSKDSVLTGSSLQSRGISRQESDDAFDLREKRMHPQAPFQPQVKGRDSADDHGSDERKPGPREEWETDFWRNKAKNSVEDILKRKQNNNVAKNLIIFMGDGMSVPTLAATRVYMGNENKQLSFEKFPSVGLSKTYCVDSQVADSACSATAYLCGIKANFGTMGVNAHVLKYNCTLQKDERNHVDSLLSWGMKEGKWAGFVTTTRVTHASPGGTYAHTANRNWEDDSEMTEAEADCKDIARQLVEDAPGKDFRVIMGGGKRAFVPKSANTPRGRRKDGTNLIEKWKQSAAEGENRQFVEDRAGLMALDLDKTDYLMGLFEWSHVQYHLHADETQPRLTEMVQAAIKLLSRQEKGFVLFVEGGRIDHGHHDDLAHLALDETVEFSEAIQGAVDATSEEDTLIVVTSDHAHTMSMAGYANRNNDIFGFAGEMDDNTGMYRTLTYANGPTGGMVTKQDGEEDPDGVDVSFPSLAKLSSETHGGDDVGIFARGPSAHLFTGVLEQNMIPHLMAYAARIGMYTDAPTASASSLSAVLALLLPSLLLALRALRA